MAMSLAEGARAHLVQFSAVRAVLGSGKGFSTWVFRGQDDMAKPFVNMEGTGAAAVLVRQQGGWSSPNRHNTMTFPRLVVEVYVDPERDMHGNEISPDVMGRFTQIQAVLDRYLRNMDHREVMWGQVRTLSCDRLDEWSVFPLPDGGGIRVSRAAYAVTLG